MRRLLFLTVLLFVLFASNFAQGAATYYEVWRNTVDNSATASRIASWLETNAYDDNSPDLGAGQTYYYWVKVITADTAYGIGSWVYDNSTIEVWLTCPTTVSIGYSSPLKYDVKVTADLNGAGLYGTLTNAIYEQDNILTQDPLVLDDEMAAWSENISLSWGTWEEAWTQDVDISAFETASSTPVYGYSYLHCGSVYLWTMTNSMNVSLHNSFDAAPTGVIASQGAYSDKIHISWDAATGNSSFSLVEQGWLVPPPPAPTGVYASKGDFQDKVRLIWNNISEATGYEIWRNVTNDSNSAVHIGTNSGSLNNVYDDTSAVSGTAYWYWVKAVNVSGVSSSFGTPDYGYRIALEGDFNGDGKVDFYDLNKFMQYWLANCSSPQWCGGTDLDQDGSVTLIDFAIFAKNWFSSFSSDIVLIPGGTFQMGDSFAEGYAWELPVHAVTLSSFYIGKYDITNQQYCDFLNSAAVTVVSGVVYASTDSSNSYPYCGTSTSDSYGQIAYSSSVFSVLTKGSRSMVNDPMIDVSWYGAAAYCNWRSQQEGKIPCYNLSTWVCDFSKNGYHLPTEAQWEYAARGGLSGKRYPWGDTITHSQANYYGGGFDPIWSADNIQPYTSPVGSFPANGYGLYDMAGNVWQWCNDWYGSYSSSPQTNPTGPTSGGGRVLRGGDWYDYAINSRVASRGSGNSPFVRNQYYGFRVSLGLN